MKALFDGSNYLGDLKARKKKSHIYEQHQLIGLEITHLLGDEKHKSLYMKLAKYYDTQLLMRLAKDIADRKTPKNRGAYFMDALEREVGKIAFKSKGKGQNSKV